MSATSSAGNLGPETVGIQVVTNSILDFLVKARPATMGIEFIGGSIKRCTTATANIGAGLKELIIFASKGDLGTFVNNDTFFVWS